MEDYYCYITETSGQMTLIESKSLRGAKIKASKMFDIVDDSHKIVICQGLGAEDGGIDFEDLAYKTTHGWEDC